MLYGLTPTGFVRKPLTQIVADLEAALKGEFGVNIRLDSRSVFGKLVGCFSQPLGEVWEVLQALYSGFDPNSAEGVILQKICQFVGVTANAATRSQVDVELVGTAGTVIAIGSLAHTSNTGDQFRAEANTTLAATVASASYTTLVGTVTNGKVYSITINGNLYSYTATVPPDAAAAVGVALKALLDAGADPITTTHTGSGALTIVGDPDAVTGLPTPFSITVNANVSIYEVGNLAEWEAANTGPVPGYAGTLTVIDTPLSGWSSIRNPLDAVLGRNLELSSALRLRRQQSVAIPGAGTPEAIRAGLLAIDDVTFAVVLENTTDAVDGNGLPPHSLAPVVLGGDAADIAAVLWARKGEGIPYHGLISETITDSQGFPQVMKFSRPTSKLMWAKITYTVDTEAASPFPSNGVALIAAALLAYGNTLTIGKDALPDYFERAALNACSGIRTVVGEVKLDGGAYQTTPYTIGALELSIWDSGRIAVTL